MNTKYTEPHIIRPKLLAWSELNLNEIGILINLFQNQSTTDCYCYLERIFELNPARFRDKIQLDLNYYALKFAILECQFTAVQISAFISIIRAIHVANTETPFENFKYLLEYFQGLMTCHSVNRPPYCIKIFDNQAVIKSINYIKNTYLKNYKLYKYTFTPIVGYNVKLNYSNEKSKPPSRLTEQETFTLTSAKQYHDTELSEILKKPSVSSADQNQKRVLPTVLPDLSTIQTFSSFSSDTDMRNYVRHFLIEELDSEPIKEKLSELEEEVFRKKHNL